MSTSVWQEVSNWLFGSFKVRASQLTDASRIQHIRLDVGSGTTESQITGANPLPITGTITGTPNVNISQYGGAATTLGQKIAAQSIPVTLSTDVSYTPTDPVDKMILVGGADAAGATATMFMTTKMAGDATDPASDYFLVAAAGLGLDETSNMFVRFRVDRDADNSTAGAVGNLRTAARLFQFDGTNWDRCRGDTTNGLDVDVTRVSGTVTVSTTTPAALTASSPTFATVGVASASAVASNASRKGLVLTNTSSNTISLGLGATAVLNSGITLTPRGVWVMDERTFTTAAVNAIASAASSNLAIQEFV